MMHPVLILAGGFGTRLKSVVPDLPKPLADVNGKPFLWWLLQELENQGAKDVYLSVGYMHEHIQNYFGSMFNQVSLHYIVESEPLGTGGAILNACQQIPEEVVLILNGDTLAKTDLNKFIAFSNEFISKLHLAVAKVSDAGRYGTVILKDRQITGFAEKGKSGEGLINAGIYILNKTLFKDFDLPNKFSFETEILMKHISELNLIAYDQVTDFIDIGIPEDYAIAQKKVPAMVLNK
ncbi:nucleotidyltransferase family protein [Methylotenera sp.]|uniref:nucleotidyltransferase family protein n=1 Tax=Methylotenera sp. TaxID=2051956 RepID=UPI002486D033|nr:nucleotidyltransferase family protein [Methylotenera sp.]MDI1298254.1 nucleotidyltransferase family protein [Methylotenera sp.]